MSEVVNNYYYGAAPSIAGGIGTQRDTLFWIILIAIAIIAILWIWKRWENREGAVYV